jgi:hypothetical protein
MKWLILLVACSALLKITGCEEKKTEFTCQLKSSERNNTPLDEGHPDAQAEDAVTDGAPAKSQDNDVSLEKVMQLRKKAIGEAEKGLQNQKLSGEERVRAAKNLLRLESHGSIPVLLDHILAGKALFEKGRKGAIDTYPIARILLSFGINIVPHILDDVSEVKTPKDNRMRNHLMAVLCHKLMGGEALEVYAKTKWLSQKPGRDIKSIENFLKYVNNLKD